MRVLFSVLLLVPLSIPVATVSAHDVAPLIQPGTSISTTVGGCTLGWVYDGVGDDAGRVFASTAAHCTTGPGGRVSVSGHGEFATVVARGWGSSGSGARGTDWALLEVDADEVAALRGTVKGHPGVPTGYTTDGTVASGDLQRYSGHGIGFSLTAQTREQRVGVLTYHVGDVWGGAAPLIFGDSGGPVFHDDGRATGYVSGPDVVAHCCAQPWGGYEVRGATVQGALVQMAAAGFTVALRNG